MGLTPWSPALLALLMLGAVSGTPAFATTVLSDPVGDLFELQSPLPPGTPIIPDITQVTAGFDASELVLTASFAPGTMTPGHPAYFVVFALDLDLNENTGGTFIQGAEQLVFLSTSMSFATLCAEIIPFPVCGAQVPVEAEPDFLRIAIPLGTDGIDDDGVARFGLTFGVFVGGGPVAGDEAYDGTSSIDRILSAESSAIVPEPGTALLVLCGLIAMGARGSSRI